MSTIDKAATVVSSSESPDPDLLPAGTLIGRYTILRALGRGAMGVVYAAHDPDLDRRVALKLVRTGEGSTSAGSTRGRVLREAKAIARLAHPNAVAVYDVGTFGADEVFIAMELVEGGTLRDAMENKQRPWRETLDLLLQAGEGLAAAHAAGLVHRDFKPDNVLLGADGRPRVADFGLARSTAEEAAPTSRAPTPSARTAARADSLADTMTMAGTIAGTPAYMSPEQMRGEVADARSDVFAFSVVVHELLYGERPFDGGSIAEILAKAEAGDLPRRTRRGSDDVPESVHDVIARGLRARPGDRYATVRDMLTALRGSLPAATRSRGPRGGVVAAVGIVLAMFGGATLWVRGRAHPTQSAALTAVTAAAPLFEATGFRRITFGDGCEEFPSFSPDGATVVYDGSDGADSAIFALAVDGLASRRITRVHGWDFAPAVSPDGKRIAFLRSSPGQSGTFVVDFTATPDLAPHMVAAGNVRPSWSPDGTAIWGGEHTHFTKLAVDDGRALRSLEVPSKYIGGQSIELPDGRLAVTFPFIAEAAAGAVGVYSPDGALRMLFDGNVGEVLARLPGPGVERVVTVRKMENSVPTLMAVALDGSGTTPLAAAGVLPRKGLTFAPDGKRVVYSTCRGSRAILTVGPDGRAALLSPGAEWEDYDLATVPGTRSFVAVSERTGRASLWLIDREQQAPPRELALPGSEAASDVAVSPDGAWAVTSLTPQGIYLVDLRGRATPHALTTDPSDLMPAFDARGEAILFTREVARHRTVMRVPVAGGDAKPLLEADTSDANVAPDGRVVYLRGASDRAVVPMILDPRTGATAPLSRALGPSAYSRPQFSPDGTKIALLDRAIEVIEVQAATGKVLRRFEHDGDQFLRVAYSGQDLLVARSAWVGDLWMADLPSMPHP